MDTRKSAGIFTRGRRGRALQAGLDEVLRGVLHDAERNLVLQSVDQLDVADRTRQLADGPGNAFIAFAADALGHFTEVPLPTWFFQSALTFDR